MSGEENMAAKNENTADDLERVNDIGPGFAKALYALGIKTFAQLAEYTPETLAKIMAENTGIKVTPDRIKTRKWIEQAKKLAAQKQQTIGSGLTGVEEEHHGWKQHAGFSIFFDYKLDEQGHKHWHTRVWKTTTYHEESGEVKELDGIETSSWVNWILEKSGLETEKLPEEQAPETVDIETLSNPSCQAEIQAIEVRPMRNTSPAIMQASIHFTPNFHDGSPPYEGVFHVELHVVQMESGISTYAGQAYQPFDPGMEKHVANIEFPIPDKTGQYRLSVSIHLFTEKSLLAVNDLSTFRVIP